MDPSGVGLRLGTSLLTAMAKKLFRQDGPGAGLVDRPVRVSALVSFRGEQRTLAEEDLVRLARELVDRAARTAGPHDALPPGETEPLVTALARSLHGLGDLDMDDVQAVRLGPAALAAELRRGQRQRGGEQLSGDAELLLDALLEAACLHILHFFTQRSTFVARTLVQQSRDLDTLRARTDLLLERTPPKSAENSTFEARYAEYVVREQSRLTVYGLDLRRTREWKLDDAYLSLEAAGREPEADDRGNPSALGAPATPQRADRALSGLPRVLLRGGAGSGKTTLLQWLAVCAARQETRQSMHHLLGKVPFPLPLRTLTRTGRPLPAPEDFLSAVNCPLAGAQPPGWPDRVLAAGRGLLLVDGIDEVPEGEREEVRRWLRRLDTAYPGNLWMVTARPSAVRADWLDAENFTELSMTPMGSREFEAFVHRWHRAVGAEPEVEQALLDLVRSRPDLSALATSPLMCALLCALHRERNGYLPRGRKALYDAALAMLLERRDRERPDPPRGALELDADTQISLLQKLAHWLIFNGRSEMAGSLAARLIGQTLPALHQGTGLGTGETVLRHLLERSGVLREPVDGTVDFVHRTFQDYLGAREVVDWQHFPALVDKAHLDQWEDVVRMAVAHAQPAQRGELLQALLERGDREPEHAVRLHLLAAACLEHATQVRPDIREAVLARAADYLPPRTNDEARTLARTGPVVLGLLPGPEGLDDDEAEAVVVAASRLATDGALKTLRAYRDHPSLAVQRQLAYSWHRFDTGRYFDEIVTHLPRDGELQLQASNAEELALLAELPGLRRINLDGSFSEEQIRTALAHHPLTALTLQNCELHSLCLLRDFGGLEELKLTGSSAVTDFTPLAGAPLRSLLFGSPPGARVSGLGALETLGGLFLLPGTELPSLRELPLRAPLRQLALPDNPPDLRDLRSWPGLTRLSLQVVERPIDPEEWGALAGLERLRFLAVRPVTLRNLAETGVVLPRITHTHLWSTDRSTPLPVDVLETMAGSLPGLTSSTFTADAEDLAPLARLESLRSLHISAPSGRVNCPPHVTLTDRPASRY
ncbi:NACHT domain-containing protein [Streptomyces sp. ACA25]|uniref:NACHT domain-containing protein n=1 Tax=Streptomyces sp. ACA25 TaxID=3022596 RepID=UPI002307D59B|nr:NACHT domain-containing protein [Streptomyces sp. ACA25]MDB1086670.1 NACHT domain-containing protein [Streptomyces sp. ACA25]